MAFPKDYKYDIGLDIGTNSVGWAVVNTEGDLARFKGRSMAGVVLVKDEGKTAKQRRMFRSSRRRLARRRQRIKILQDLMADFVLKDDPNFFERLKYSYYSKNDESGMIDYATLFDNSYYNFRAIAKKYPTIYHLRYELATSNQAMDPRLIYLAIHHIVKYRGNFLFDGDIEIQNLKLDESIKDMLKKLDLDFTSDDINSLVEIIKDSKKTKSEKIDSFKKTLKRLESQEESTLLKGWEECVSKLVFSGKYENKQSKIKISFLEDVLPGDLADEELEVLDSIRAVYNGGVLSLLTLDANETISESFIAAYNKHKEQLSNFKKIIKKYDPEKYYDLINNKTEKVISYANYINNAGKTSNKDISEEFKKELKVIRARYVLDPIVDEYLKDIEEGRFLLKPRNTNNSVIPNQFHVNELIRIIDNQAKFYPELFDIKDKIVRITEFRIPYSVGPLSTNSQYSWLKRTDEKIFPWNFENVVDVMASSEEFIKRAINNCTYLKHEKVLPKNSLLFSEYMVYNELSNISINGHKLDGKLKLVIVDELFKKHKKVTKKKFKAWYKKRFPELKDINLTGLADDEFKSNLSSLIDMEKILGKIEYSYSEEYKLAEKIIEYVTVFKDKNILKRFLEEKIEKTLTEEQIQRIVKLSFSGWGSLSKRLLVGITVKDNAGYPYTVMDCFKNNRGANLQEIIYKRGFIDVIEKENKLHSEENKSIREFIRDNSYSPAIAKVTEITYEVVKEIVKITGNTPRNIYFESSKGEDTNKKKTENRYDKIKKLYQKFSDAERQLLDKVNKELNLYEEEKKELDKEKLFLYFLQCGKSLYTQEPLGIEHLNEYDIDHIIPRSLKPMDGISNRVLITKKENETIKQAGLVLPEVFRTEKNIAFWKKLNKMGLLDDVKLKNLCRSEFSEKDIEGFLERQAVETSQINKNISTLFKEIYPNVSVKGVSYILSSNVRKELGLPKIRGLNDFHHVHDAYRAVLIGSFVDEENYRSFASEFENLKYKENEDRYGVIARRFAQLKRNYIDKLNKSVYDTHDFYVNCKTERQTGAFYDQTQKKASEKNLISKKKEMSTNVYGGYKNENDAFFVVINNPKEKKIESKIVGIPIRIAAFNDDERVREYIRVEYGDKAQIDSKIGRIYKYQLIIYNDQKENDETKVVKVPYYLVGDRELINARQLWLSKKSYQTLNYLMNMRKNKLDKKSVIALYSEYCNKLKDYYPRYETIYKKLFTSKDEIEKICGDGVITKENTQKLKEIFEKLLIITKTDSKRVEKKSIFENGSIIDSRSPLRKNIDASKMIIRNSSITGMYTKGI